MVRRNNNRRRTRRPRARPMRRSNVRSVVLFRRPPNPGPVPRNTGLSAGGLTTTVAFTINVSGTASGSTTNTGWSNVTLTTTHLELSPNYIFGQRTDSIKALLAIYSEYRINRITVHWTPQIGTSGHGTLAFAIVDGSFGIFNGLTYSDVAVTPNASQTYIGQRSGRAWVPTEPTSLDWRGPTTVAAHILYAAQNVFIPVGSTSPVTLGQFFVRVNVSCRSPTQASGLADRLITAMEI